MLQFSIPSIITQVVSSLYNVVDQIFIGQGIGYLGERDGIANPRTMEQRVNAMKAAGIPTEFHLYRNLGYGFALGTGTSAEGWVTDAVRFWEKL
jgi:Na+-driven multidrug efflux pump